MNTKILEEAIHHLKPETLLIIALIIIISKLASSFSIKLKQPPVLGMLIIGLVVGPSGLKLLHTNPFIEIFAEIGVIFLLFMAGLETDLQSMKKAGKSSFLVALNGIFFPFGLGFAVGYFFGFPLFKTLIIATIYTATSVSVSVMTLLDMKKLRTVEGTTILGAAVIDDIIAIILLTLIFGLYQPGANIFLSVGTMLGYMLGAVIVGLFLFKPIMHFTKKMKAEHSILAIGLGICFLFSWAAHEVKIAPITGAYLAGLFLGRTKAKHSIMEGVETIGHSIFVSVFFLNIGLATHLWDVPIPFLFAAIFAFGAAFSKVIGSGLGARLSGFSWKRALPIGFGMMPRGEVSLVIALMAKEAKIFTQADMSVIVFMIIFTAILTPFLLKWSFHRKDKVLPQK